jgi:predicted Rossmann fold nucleotide-binding protein DprA/Smf involved in DNA uptake
VTSSVAQGTNSLLKQGAAAITGTDDVLDELFGVGVRRAPPPGTPPRGPDDPLLRDVLEAAERYESVEGIARATARTAGQTRAALGRLEADGYLVRRDLGGWERAAC